MCEFWFVCACVVIDRKKECKWCKRPVNFRKISKELDPKLLACFDLAQHTKLEDLGRNLKLAQLQYKHISNPWVLMRMEQKTRDMRKLDLKLVSKISSMQKMLLNVENPPRGNNANGSIPSFNGGTTSGSNVTPSSGCSGTSSGGRSGGYFGPMNVRKEPLLQMMQMPSGNSRSSSFVQPERSSFVPATNMMRPPFQQQQQPQIPLKRHPQITRL